VIIRSAKLEDLKELTSQDHPLDIRWVQRCIELDEYIVAEKEGEIIGFLRFSMFWGKIPYMDMIRVVEKFRNKGIGKQLYTAWEEKMENSGAEVLMTSSMSDEIEPQEWHIKNGFQECGNLTFGKLQDTPELFFVKNL